MKMLYSTYGDRLVMSAVNDKNMVQGGQPCALLDKAYIHRPVVSYLLLYFSLKPD